MMRVRFHALTEAAIDVCATSALLMLAEPHGHMILVFNKAAFEPYQRARLICYYAVSWDLWWI
jgi:hypothetical protein